MFDGGPGDDPRLAQARALKSFEGVSGDVLRTQRREKFLGIGRSI